MAFDDTSSNDTENTSAAVSGARDALATRRLLGALREKSQRTGAGDVLDLMQRRVIDAFVRAALREHGAASLGELARRDVNAADAVVARAQRVRALARQLRAARDESATSAG